jgi:hypothetical protein
MVLRDPRALRVPRGFPVKMVRKVLLALRALLVRVYLFLVLLILRKICPSLAMRLATPTLLIRICIFGTVRIGLILALLPVRKALKVRKVPKAPKVREAQRVRKVRKAQRAHRALPVPMEALLAPS